MRDTNAVSIIVPTLNEVRNIAPLVKRIDAAMQAAGVAYEVVFVDDHSTDRTAKAVKSLSAAYPLRVEFKVGKRGKAYSLLQGFAQAKYDIICMIDADLQYPPEAIPAMLGLLQEHSADIIITNRIVKQTNGVRRLASSVFNYLFVQVLFGFNYDTQSGLKLFRKSVLDSLIMKPKPWSFDLEFIVRALEKDYKILPFDIPFSERHAGREKIHLLSSSLELASESLKLRATSSGKTVRRAYKANAAYISRAFGLLALIGLATLAVPAIPKAQAVAITLPGVTQIQLLPASATAPTTATSAPAATPVAAQSASGTSLTPANQNVTQPVIAASQPLTDAAASTASATAVDKPAATSKPTGSVDNYHGKPVAQIHAYAHLAAILFATGLVVLTIPLTLAVRQRIHARPNARHI